MAKPTLRDIATRINAHLKRFEGNKQINRLHRSSRTRPYYYAGAWMGLDAWVHVTYVSYQGGSNLRRAEAERYLAWLDAGNIGTHWEATNG